MIEILSYAFFQNALVGVILVGLVSAVIGSYVVSRRMVFITGGITHSCFGGLGLGFFLGISPILMAAITAVASAIGVEWLTTKQKVREDSAIGVVWALGMALGTLFIFLTPGYVPELTSFLFGNILTITISDLVWFASFAIVMLLLIAIFFPQIVSCAFDRDFAYTRGLPVGAINAMMSVIVALSVVMTIRLIGIMLLMSLLTLPQLVAEQFTHRLKPMMIYSAVISIVCSVAGLFCSYWVSVPASATIVILLIATYLITRFLRLKKKSTILIILSAMTATAWAATPKAPAFLKEGDKVAIITPAGTITKEKIDSACSVLTRWGLEPVVGSHATGNWGYFGGTIPERVNDFKWALNDTSIRAIMCSRGGYGSIHVLNELKPEELKNCDKWIVGYSDITAIHSALCANGVMSIHGSMAGRLKDTGGNDSLSVILHDLLFGKLPSYTIESHPYNHRGAARGKLVGGNLSLICSLADTKIDFLNTTDDIILFLEEVGESCRIIDRMLQSLKTRGVLSRVKGIIVGNFHQCSPTPPFNTPQDVLHYYLSDYDIPIAFDFPVGHDEERNAPLIVGATATLVVDDNRVDLFFDTISR